jgi:hypothetical protein
VSEALAELAGVRQRSSYWSALWIGRTSLAVMLIGHPSLVPQIWPDDRFDVEWVFECDAGGPGSASVSS